MQIKTRTYYLLFISLLISCLGVRAQVSESAPHRPATLVEQAKAQGATFQSTSLFELNSNESRLASHPILSQALRDGTILSLKKQTISELLQNPAPTINLSIPSNNGTQTLKLVRVDIIDPYMKIQTSSMGEVSVDMGIHYHGTVEGHTNSIAAVSIFENQIMGLISSDEIAGNLVLGKIQEENEERHILYHDGDLKTPMTFGCLTPDDGQAYTPSQLLPSPKRRAAGDCVLVSVEVNYNIYTNSGSDVQDVTNFIVGIFNQAILLFANESINMGIRDIFIWTSPSYFNGNAEEMRDEWQDSTSSILGDIGHLISWRSSGAGGIAAGFNALCNGNVDEKLCVTQLSLSYQNVPTYSRQVKVVTHEMGHLLGSRHTHACVWNGNGTTIDDYGNVDPDTLGVVNDDAEGKSCFSAPGKTDSATNVPTIMSYYDSFGWGAFSMGNGFGTQPGDVIRNSVENAGCLNACCDMPIAKCKNITRSLGAISGTVSITANDIDNVSTFDCGLMSLTASETSFDCDDVGGNSVTLTVTDIYYRTSQCNATVTIEDNTNPTAQCKNITVFLDANGDASITANQIDNNSFDNCDIQSRVADPNTFDCSTVGAQSSTLTVTDEHGNTGACQAGVFVDDTAAKPPKLSKQSCNNCNQLRIFYCQFDPSPASFNDFIDGTVEMNDTYVPGNPLFWYVDNGGSRGAPFAGNGSEPPTPNMNNAAATYFYWVAQINQASGCVGDAIRVRVRVRKTPTPVFGYGPSQHCYGGQIDLPEWVDDPNNVADVFDFYNGDPDGGGSFIGSVNATNGSPNAGEYVIVMPQIGINEYWVVATNKGNSNSITCVAKTSMTIPVADTASLDTIPNYTFDHGDNVVIPFSSPDAGYIVWSDHSSFNNPDIGLIGNIGLGNLAFQAYNPGSQPITAMIRVMTFLNGCAGQYRDFFITVNPSPIRLGSHNRLALTAYQLSQEEVQLEWDITYNQDLIRFEVERMKSDISPQDDYDLWLNEENWERLGSVEYNESKSNYTFMDANAASQATKYRLKLVHADGSIVWSDIVEVNFNLYEGDRFVLYPNPSDGLFHLKSALPLSEGWNYQLVDVLGREIAQGELKEEGQSFDLSAETPGLYFLVINNPDGKRSIKRMVKK